MLRLHRHGVAGVLHGGFHILINMTGHVPEVLIAPLAEYPTIGVLQKITGLLRVLGVNLSGIMQLIILAIVLFVITLFHKRTIIATCGVQGLVGL